MTHLRITTVALALLVPLMFGLGCGRSSAPPPPLTVGELPAAFTKAFSKAKPEAKDEANRIVAAIQAQDYSTAFHVLSSLVRTGSLTEEQVEVTSRALLTVNTLLQEAEAKGDAKAAETIKVYRSTK